MVPGAERLSHILEDCFVLAQKGSLYLTRPTLFTYVQAREELLASAAAVFDVIARGAVKVEINQRWPLEQAADAVAETATVEESAKGGKKKKG